MAILRRTTKTGRRTRRRRGFTLLETLLALGVGAIVLVSSVAGLQRYTEGVRVQAAASTLERLASAADEWASENYDAIVAAAPRRYDISVLRGYYSQNVRSQDLRDSFRNEFHIATRKYSYAGGNEALQVLVVGQPTTDTTLSDKEVLRSDIASSTGAGAGFIASENVSCTGASPGDICGAFGSYFIPVSDFNVSGPGPVIDWGNASVVALINKGDVAVYGEQLYRFDIGDDDLNTMSTDLHMGEFNITDVGTLDGGRVEVDEVAAGTFVETPLLRNTNRIDMTGATSVIRNTAGNMRIQSSDDTEVIADNVRVALRSGGTMQVGSGSGHSMVVGALTPRTIDGVTSNTGSGSLFAGRSWLDEIRTNRVNSLTGQHDDPLRLQHNVTGGRGEVVIGNRVRYQPDQGLASSGNAGGIYEIADGTLMAGHLKAADITCADCGGTLSEILPKWRHMGTYYIRNTGGNTYIPAPSCTSSRRDMTARGANAAGPSFNETRQDARYEPKIVIVPRQLAAAPAYQRDGGGGDLILNYSMQAVHEPGNQRWRVMPTTSSNQFQTGLAMTYCVFVGGQNPSPSNGAIPALTNPGSGSWAILD